MRKTTYEFVVREQCRVDLNGIVRENPLADLVVVGAGHRKSLLMARASFLAMFSDGDNVRVLGERLDPRWGTDKIRWDLKDRGLEPRTDSGATPEGWRSATFDRNNIGDVLDEIQASYDYKRSIEVGVMAIQRS
jgi:hypothetical protein